MWTSRMGFADASFKGTIFFVMIYCRILSLASLGRLYKLIFSWDVHFIFCCLPSISTNVFNRFISNPPEKKSDELFYSSLGLSCRIAEYKNISKNRIEVFREIHSYELWPHLLMIFFDVWTSSHNDRRRSDEISTKFKFNIIWRRHLSTVD